MSDHVTLGRGRFGRNALAALRAASRPPGIGAAAPPARRRAARRPGTGRGRSRGRDAHGVSPTPRRRGRPEGQWTVRTARPRSAVGQGGPSEARAELPHHDFTPGGQGRAVLPGRTAGAGVRCRAVRRQGHRRVGPGRGSAGRDRRARPSASGRAEGRDHRPARKGTGRGPSGPVRRAQNAVDAAAVAVKVKGVEVKRAKDIVAARKIDLDVDRHSLTGRVRC